MRTAGIDPGLTGAVAVFNDAGELEAVFDMPTHGGCVYGWLLARELKRYQIDHAYVELTHAMPKNGSKAAFSQGDTWGAIRTALQVAAVPFTTVSPIVWKTRFGLNQRGLTDAQRKEASRLRAIQLFPHCEVLTRKKDHNRAEAILIGKYAHQEQA